jgi:hypothetical protein
MVYLGRNNYNVMAKEVLVESKKLKGRIYSLLGDNEKVYLWFGLLLAIRYLYIVCQL